MTGAGTVEKSQDQALAATENFRTEKIVEREFTTENEKSEDMAKKIYSLNSEPRVTELLHTHNSKIESMRAPLVFG